MKDIISKPLQLTAVIIEDPEGGFTGYFAEFPEAIAEGETEDELEENLLEAFKSVLDYRREENENSSSKGISKKTKMFNLEVA